MDLFASLIAVGLLTGCDYNQSQILNSVGPVAEAQRNLMLTATVVMLLLIVPVIVATLLVAWHFRASDRNAGYTPEWSYSAKVDLFMWGVPAIIVIFLASLSWRETHRLDPYKILPPGDPFIVAAVSLDWKWLFIYPDLNIATVNELAAPAGRPVTIRLTSDTVMTSFMIPGIAGQIYAMPGMETSLNFIANRPGTYLGRNMQYSGDGFPGQKFDVTILSEDEFDIWAENVKSSERRLDNETFKVIAKQSSDAPISYFGLIDPDLFSTVIDSHAGPSDSATPARAAHDKNPRGH